MSNRYFHLSLLLSWHTWALLWCLEWSAQMLSTTVFDRCLKVGGCLQCSNAQVPRRPLRSDLKRLIPHSLLSFPSAWWKYQLTCCTQQEVLSACHQFTQKMLAGAGMFCRKWAPFHWESVEDTKNYPEKAKKISNFNPNQSAPSIYIMTELCYISLDQWEIRIHLLWGKSFNIPLHCDPHLNQTKWLIFNDLLPLTIPGVLGLYLCFIVV